MRILCIKTLLVFHRAARWLAGAGAWCHGGSVKGNTLLVVSKFWGSNALHGDHNKHRAIRKVLRD